jgi:glycosyltransferase involved in cell wall biosynthesis
MSHILIACSDFTTISGQPMFVYDLGSELVRRGWKVTVAAPNVGGVMAEKGRLAGMECLTFGEARGQSPDILHVQAVAPAHWAISRWPHLPVISTVHSQLIYETPYIHDNVRHYACVRPEIVAKIISQDGAPWNKTSVIYNGIDLERFRRDENAETLETPTILFAGTVDYLRAQASHMTMNLAKERGWNVLFIGRRMSGQLNELPDHVSYIEGDIWDIQDHIKKCSATAGVLLGRTLIEGWASGVPGLVYEIDTEGMVTDWGEYAPPPPQLMKMFDIKFMVDMYERHYDRALG